MSSSDDKPKFPVESLIRQCQSYIVMHLEEYPVSYLSLLPLTTRDALLWQLPVADVCQLEGTQFTEGLDMTAYWKFPWENNYVIGGEETDVKKYVEQLDQTEYARAEFYGQVFTYLIDLHDVDMRFRMPREEVEDTIPNDEIDVIELLYAGRMFSDHASHVTLVLPPRYEAKDDACDYNDLIKEVVGCFNGEVPTIFSHIHLDSGFDRYHNNIIDHFSKVVYLSVHGELFANGGLEFLKTVIQKNSSLEVLILEGPYFQREKPISLDDLCTFLYSCPTFWQSIKLFKLLEATCCIRLDCDDSAEYKYVVSREVLENLIAVYFSSPTSHAQKIQLTSTAIVCCDIFDNNRPKIDQRFIHLKTCELNECDFVAINQATYTSVSKWLDQPLSQLSDDLGTCVFKLVDKEKRDCPSRSRKRKYFELLSDNDYEE